MTRLFTSIIAIIATVSAFAITTAKPNGNGTAAAPYQISNAAELYWFAQEVNNDNAEINAVLTSDIKVNDSFLRAGQLFDLPENEWTAIGSAEHPFVGKFDGQGHTISGIYFVSNDESAEQAGLFGYVSGATIKNVTIADSYFDFLAMGIGTYVGSICGFADNNTTIDNVAAKNTYVRAFSNDYTYAGGICGIMFDSSIKNAKNYAEVSSRTRRGAKCFTSGIVASAMGSYIEDCSNAGFVTGATIGENYTAGLVAYASSSSMSNSSNTGLVTGGSENTASLVAYSYRNDLANNTYVMGTASYNHIACNGVNDPELANSNDIAGQYEGNTANKMLAAY